MANGNKGVVIRDAEFQQAAKDIINYAQQLNEMMSAYVAGVNKVMQNGIQSQRLANKLSRVTEQVVALQEPMLDISNSVQKTCAKYISDVDSADQFLY